MWKLAWLSGLAAVALLAGLIVPIAAAHTSRTATSNSTPSSEPTDRFHDMQKCATPQPGQTGERLCFERQSLTGAAPSRLATTSP